MYSISYIIIIVLFNYYKKIYFNRLKYRLRIWDWLFSWFYAFWKVIVINGDESGIYSFIVLTCKVMGDVRWRFSIDDTEDLVLDYLSIIDLDGRCVFHADSHQIIRMVALIKFDFSIIRSCINSLALFCYQASQRFD